MMVAELGQTIIPLDSQTAKTVQVGDTLKIEMMVKDDWAGKSFSKSYILRSYRVMVVDRINELVACKEL